MAQNVHTAAARRSTDEGSEHAPGPILAWIAGVMAWLFAAASMVSFSPFDWPGRARAPITSAHDAANWGRQVGAWFSFHAFEMLGSGAWLMLLAAGAYLILIARRIRVTHPATRGVGVLMLAIGFSSLHALFLPTATTFPEGAGGLIAITGVDALLVRFGTFGTTLWIFLLMAIGATIAFDRWLLWLPQIAASTSERTLNAAHALFIERLIPATRRAMARTAAARANDIDDDHRLRSARALVESAERARRKRSRRVEIDEEAGGIGGGDEFDPKDDARIKDEADMDVVAGTEADAFDIEDDEAPGAPQVFDPDALRQKIAKLPVRFANIEKRSANEDDLDALRAQRRTEEEADRNYVFPGLDLLENPESNYNDDMERYVREQAEGLEAALRTYKISGEVVEIDSGPVITLYQVRLAPGTKVSSIQAISSDIARSLKAVNVRIVSNTEGLDTVGIEVPNRLKEKVRLKELMTSSDRIARMKLPLFLGKDASGNPLISDLAKLPHMLIAGTTGSGKSVCMNAIIMGFLYTQKPSDLKLVLVDPKMVEMSQFKDIPHLMCPVVTEMSKAAAILEWAVTKMDERYELLAEAGCRDIASYNSLDWEELKERFNPQNEIEEAKIPRKLPYMVFIIDELADLMMTNKEVESSIVRIAQKARAVGIHLILATQRPQANVVTGLIKSNMPGRLAFKVASGMDSRIVLDQKGGELLLGQGDMLMITPQSSATLRAQGTLVEDSEIRRVVRFIRSVSEPSFERSLVGIRNSGYETPEDHEERMRQSAQEDPLFDRAVEIVLETRRGSVSLLQRRLAIGYTRASRLIELMGQAGIIGEHKGSVAREVMMTVEEWDAIKAQAEADAGGGEDEREEQSMLFPEPKSETPAATETHDAELPEGAPFEPTSIDVSLDATREASDEADTESLAEAMGVDEADDDAEVDAEDAVDASDDAEVEDAADDEIDDEEAWDADDEADETDEEEDAEVEDLVEEEDDEVEDAEDEDAAEVEDAEAEDDAEDDYEYEYEYEYVDEDDPDAEYEEEDAEDADGAEIEATDAEDVEDDADDEDEAAAAEVHIRNRNDSSLPSA